MVTAPDPAKFTTTERSTLIHAPAEVILALLTDFTEWPAWSPFDGIDPALQREYGGEQGSVGAHYAWHGNRKAGAGSMTVSAIAADGTDIDLQFTKPFKTESMVHFGLAQSGESTTVVWTMYSPKNAVSRVMGIFMNFDTMIGGDFEKGLAKLKTLAESRHGV